MYFPFDFILVVAREIYHTGHICSQICLRGKVGRCHMITQFFVINNNITFILPHSVQHSEYRIEGMGGGKKSTADSDYKIIEDT